MTFCATTLSAFYCDILKDRLYASAAASPERRSAQTALWRIGRALAAVMAPVLPFTAEEIWAALPGKKEESVHLARFDGLNDFPVAADSNSEAAWERLTKLREEASVILEQARRDKIIGSSLEGAIALSGSEALEADRAATGTSGTGLADLLIVSEIVEGAEARPAEWRDSPGLPRREARFPQGPGTPVRPLLEGDARSRCDRTLRPLPRGPRRGRGMTAKLRESTLYRGAYLAVSLAVLFLDQWTKGIITRTMDVHQSRTIVANVFDLTYVRNSGAAFGLFASVDSALKAILLNSVAVIVFLIVSAYALRSSHKSVRLQVGLALILGGAVGNLLDRVRFGYVVDFLDFAVSGHHWPAFNVADSAICIGVAVLFLDMLRHEDEPKPVDAAPGT